MNPQTIQDALIAVCKTTAQSRSLSPVMPGYEYEKAPKPCLVFGLTPATRPAVTLKGGEVLREFGVFSADLVIEQGIGTTTANAHAAAIASDYAEGSRIAISGGKITIMKPADIRKGYPDGPWWRVPIIVTYQADVTV